MCDLVQCMKYRAETGPCITFHLCDETDALTTKAREDITDSNVSNILIDVFNTYCAF